MTGGRAALPWLLAVAGGAAAGAAAGALEGLLSAAAGGCIGAALGAGSFGGIAGAVTGLFTSLALLAVDGAGLLDAAIRGWPRLRREPAVAAAVTARIAVFTAAGVALLAVLFHGARFSATAFHHAGLAALLLTAAIFGLLALFLLAARAAVRALEPLLCRLPGKVILASGSGALAVPPAVFALLVVLPPDSGEGLLGFLGLLRREELELAHLGLLAAPVPAAAAACLFAHRRRSRRAPPPLPLIAVLFVLTGASLAGFVHLATSWDTLPPAATETIERRAPLASRLLGLARRLTDRDRDGFSALFGGGDCDDANPARNPAAANVPGSGVDEDCSGRDALISSAPDGPRAEAAAPDAGPAATAAPPGELSLVLLTVDALRWDAPGCMGYPRRITPNIDEVADRGVVFERAYAMSSYTGRSLLPILIGRYPSETRCDAGHFTRYHPENVTLAEVLAAQGFRTFGVGSHPYFERGGVRQGFERFETILPPGDADFDQKITSPGVADAAVAMLGDEELTAGRFFLWAHFMDPHRDYLPHPGFDFGSAPRERYDGEVAFADHHLGRVLAALERRGLAGRTIVLVTADHGEAFGEHDIRYHGRRLWEEVVRVPLVIAAPGLEPRRVRTRVSHVSLMRTLCELLGVDPPPDVRGPSLVPLLGGGEGSDHTIFLDQPLGQYIEEMYGLVAEGHKLIHSLTGNRFQLFDLEADPGETADLSRTDPERLWRMKERYQRFRAALDLRADRYRPK